MIRLLTYDTFPPGSYIYVQPGEITRKFGGSYGAVEQAKRISDFRRGNKLPRSSPLECLEDLDRYTCDRLNNNPAFCYDTEAPISQGSGLVSSPSCPTCGAQVT